MSDKESILIRLQNHQCSVQEAEAALDYIYAEKARGLLDACKIALQAIKDCDMEVGLLNAPEHEIVGKLQAAIAAAEKGE